MDNGFDVIVIGGGHAGCEAALAAARMGARAAMFTMNTDHIGFMSCNPAIGGQAKGQLAREVDALGGEMGINTDKSAIQYKKLNMSKGPAVRSSRAQCDKVLYSLNMKQTVESQERLSVSQREVVDIVISNGKVTGVITHLGETIPAKAVIITAGTFLKAVMHCGERISSGGRVGDGAANSLSLSLSANGFDLVRLKTGTPPRLRKGSIDFDSLVREDGDLEPTPFSFYVMPKPFPFLEQMPCFITHTNAATHELIAANRERSPMFSGQILGRGPRYCPSIEDKVFRFADKDRHQIFLEPESRFSQEIYANGLSTSLPMDVQLGFLRTIKGLESVEVARAGYAVEYDAIQPTILKHSLEVKGIDGLFFAGQVNGTSGYEEAAAQGMMAGINAVKRALGEDPVVLARNQAYIGVMIDDLVTLGCDEPYRMFTSRAEFRLTLREDTADARLAPLGRILGLLSDEKYRIFSNKYEDINKLRSYCRDALFYSTQDMDFLSQLSFKSLPDRISLDDLLKMPEFSFSFLKEKAPTHYPLEKIDFLSNPIALPGIFKEAETLIKYAGYIQRENEMIERMKKQETRPIPLAFNYQEIQGLSNEAKEKLGKIRPETLGQASRIPGITPAAVALVYLHISRTPGKVVRELN